IIGSFYSYSDEKTTIFKDKKIGQYYNKHNQTSDKNKNDKNLEYLNEYNVIRLTMSECFSECSIEEGIEEIKNCIIDEVKNTIKDFENLKVKYISRVFNEIVTKTKRQIIFVIDDWDYVLIKKTEEKENIKKYLGFLNSFLKNFNNRYTAFAFITGTFPINIHKASSYLKMFDEYSNILPGWTAKYFGYTDDEVQELLVKTQSISNIKYEDLKDSYSSYQLIDNFSNEIYKIYSPYLILESLKNNIVKRYQMDNDYYDLLAKFIQKNYENLKDVITLLIESERDKKK
ncbi:hypothetical protein BCR36DRAFT_307763, partial [Piromyces finnis]